MSDYAYEIRLIAPGSRPPFNEVVDHVYGAGSNVDTDGDSNDRESTSWTWLYMQLRPTNNNPVVEITMENGNLFVASDDPALVEKTAKFLAQQTGAALCE